MCAREDGRHRWDENHDENHAWRPSKIHWQRVFSWSCVRGASCSSLRARPASSHTLTCNHTRDASDSHTLHAKVKAICDAAHGTPDDHSLPKRGVPSRRAAARTLPAGCLGAPAASTAARWQHGLLPESRRYARSGPDLGPGSRRSRAAVRRSAATWPEICGASRRDLAPKSHRSVGAGRQICGLRAQICRVLATDLRTSPTDLGAAGDRSAPPDPQICASRPADLG